MSLWIDSLYLEVWIVDYWKVLFSTTWTGGFEKKGLKKTHTVLSSATSEWKYPSVGDTENESETMTLAIYDDGFDSNSSDEEIHLPVADYI